MFFYFFLDDFFDGDNLSDINRRVEELIWDKINIEIV